MNVYELTSRMYKCKKVAINLCTHHEDDSETWEHITLENTKEDKYATSDTYRYRDFKVIMFEPVKKGHIEIWAIKDEKEITERGEQR